jgi:hypothetical protein
MKIYLAKKKTSRRVVFVKKSRASRCISLVEIKHKRNAPARLVAYKRKPIKKDGTGPKGGPNKFL